MLSEKAVQKFKKLYEQRFNEKLTDKEAYQRANKLLNLYRAVYTPLIQREKNNENDYDNQKTNY
jgi:hypothetical protein